MTTAIQIKPSPKGPTQNPPIPADGLVRYNEKLGQFETYNASWDNLSSLVGNLGPIVGFQAYQNSTRQVLPDRNSFTIWQVTYAKKRANTKLFIYANLVFFANSGIDDPNTGIGIGGMSVTGNFQSCLPLTSEHRSRLATGMGLFDNLPAGNHDIHFGWALNHPIARRPANIFNPNKSDNQNFTQHTSGALVVEAAF